MPCSSARRATGDGFGLPCRPDGGVGPGEHRDHLVARRVDQAAQRGQRGFGGSGEDKAHRHSVGSSDAESDVDRAEGSRVMTLTTISGLPAHVLLVHGLVVLVPLTRATGNSVRAVAGGAAAPGVAGARSGRGDDGADPDHR